MIEIMSQMVDDTDRRIMVAARSPTGDTPTVIDKPIPHRLS